MGWINDIASLARDFFEVRRLRTENKKLVEVNSDQAITLVHARNEAASVREQSEALSNENAQLRQAVLDLKAANDEQAKELETLKAELLRAKNALAYYQQEDTRPTQAKVKYDELKFGSEED